MKKPDISVSGVLVGRLERQDKLALNKGWKSTTRLSLELCASAGNCISEVLVEELAG